MNMAARSGGAMSPRGALDSSGHSLAIFTALYELTMSQAWWQSGNAHNATFSLFIRRFPPNRSYFVLAGVHDILDYLTDFRFTEADIAYLGSLGRFDGGFLEFLADLQFTGSVRAMREGEIFFADEPVMEISGPVIECQILENYVINRISLQTMLATKAARVMHAARGRPVTYYGSRRAPGIDAAGQMARVGSMTGFAGTGNVLAAAQHGITPMGTMAHSFVGSFPTELDAFRAFARSFPDASTFLIDTYDPIEGARNAITVALEMKEVGHKLGAVRLDSGDLLNLSRRVRAMLDGAGLEDVDIVASGELDEFVIDSQLRDGAPIAGFGVGTRIGSSADAPWTDSVYKLVEYAGEPVLKLSVGKETLPGRKQIYRHEDKNGGFERDVIAMADEPPPNGATSLLEEVMRDGRALRPHPTLDDSRELFRRGSAALPEDVKALTGAATYPVAISPALAELQIRMAEAAHPGGR